MAAVISDGTPGLLDRKRIVARAGFNRWLVPPAALAIHLCIGMSYGLSVFWLPLAQALGISKPTTCPDMSLMQELFTTSCDWRVSSLLVTFELGIVFLGLAAAAFGGWLERAGPRRAGVAAALCWGGGFLVAALAVYIHQLWLFWLGLGVIGGVGLGLGYISPVSTLIKWFPDRRGMATGMAIMGFGGGAMIGSPLAILLMNHFKNDQSAGVAEAMAVMGCIYLVFMLCGAFGYRVPPDGWKPDGWTPPTDRAHALITTGNVHLNDAHKTPQFWLIWIALWMNVSAGIGVLAMASPMLQEIFGGSLIGQDGLRFGDLNPAQHAAIAGIAGGFVSLLSLFNSGGRFVWASLSDALGRKVTYFCFFILGMILYVLAPTFAHMGSVALFAGALCIIISMYGGGFSTLPAYLADIFGTQFVGAIHGRMLTAWSAAGILGPLVVGYIRDAEIAAGVPRADVYDYTLYILTGFLFIGLVANALVSPVHDKRMMTDEQLATLQTHASTATLPDGSHGIGFGGFSPAVLVAWLAVGVPFLWGVWNTLVKAVALFG